MRMVVEVLVAFLAAGGLLALGWLLFGRLLSPIGGTCGHVSTLVPARGGGENLEHDLSGLLWLRAAGLARFRVIIVDDGLNAAGLAIAAALLERDSGIQFCKREELEDIL